MVMQTNRRCRGGTIGIGGAVLLGEFNSIRIADGKLEEGNSRREVQKSAFSMCSSLVLSPAQEEQQQKHSVVVCTVDWQSATVMFRLLCWARDADSRAVPVGYRNHFNSLEIEVCVSFLNRFAVLLRTKYF